MNSVKNKSNFSIKLRKFIMLNIEDCSVFTIFDSDSNKIFTGSASDFFDICLKDSSYQKYLTWDVLRFSSDEILIADLAERRDFV